MRGNHSEMMQQVLKIALLLCLFGLLQGSPTTPYRKGFGPGEQEWGHIDVRQGAHMFYWLFYVQNPKVASYYDRPLVIWLQGGPGGSSSGYGNFEEIGPLYRNKTARPSSWANHVNLMFIDNPVGAGFSYVDDLKYLTRTNQQIGRDMVSFLTTFYKKFPKFEKTPLYIYTESYGGKMGAEIARQLLDAIKKGGLKINFQGVGLGDSWISPMDSVNTWAPFLYYTGMVDKEGMNKINAGAQRVQKAVNSGQWTQATDLWRQLEVDIMKVTSNINFYNILYKEKPMYQFDDETSESSILVRGPDDLQNLMEGPVKSALGIPPQIVHNRQSGAVFKYLSEDFMKPVINVVEDLLNNTSLQVVVFTGNLDLIVDTPGTVVWVDNMRWKGASTWKTVPRKPLVVKNYIEGYVKNLGNFYFYWIHRAGHMVPSDNPDAALEMLRLSTKFDKK